MPYYHHDPWCFADRRRKMGCLGCTCEMYVRAKEAERRVVELEKEVARLRVDKPSLLKKWWHHFLTH